MTRQQSTFKQKLKKKMLIKYITLYTHLFYFINMHQPHSNLLKHSMVSWKFLTDIIKVVNPLI